LQKAHVVSAWAFFIACENSQILFCFALEGIFLIQNRAATIMKTVPRQFLHLID